MNGHEGASKPENPFSSRQIRPGATAFVFDPCENTATLLERLHRGGWWGQITGPHGSGKSSLLAVLIPMIEAAGRRVALVELHDGQRRLSLDAWNLITSPTSAIVLVDGYEQLSWLSRWRLKRFCRRRRLGLVVTTHVSVGLPDLLHCAPRLPLAVQIVDQLQRGYPRLITPEDVAQRFARHDGNLREMLFDLYDLYEARRERDGG